MFQLNSGKYINTDQPLIVGGYQVLHFDEDPILFGGLNRFGGRVVGTLIQSDYKNKKDYYFHVVVDDGTYAAFINQKFTYLDILASARPVFVIEKDLENDKDTVYHYDLADIPTDYRPSAFSYCPEQEIEPTFIYPVSLVGGLADTHRANPETIGKTANLIAGFLRAPLKRLRKIRDVYSEVYLQALPGGDLVYEGSFKVNYNVSIDPQQLSLFRKPQEYLSFLNAFISYCLSKLPDDALLLSQYNISNLARFNQLLEEFEALIGVSPKNKDQQRDAFVDDVLKAATDLKAISDTIGEEYHQIVLANLSKVGEHPLGVINQSYREEIQVAMVKVDEGLGKVIISDQEPKSYKIHVYDLNTDSRKGRALLQHPTEEDKLMKPSITISGTDPISGTKFTESLHLDKYIEVQGKGIHVDGILKRLDVIFEP